jgi:hypothetical protein
MSDNVQIFAWLGLIGLVWIVRELLLGLWAWRKARYYVHILKTEKTRAEFAAIRNRLSRLPFEGHIDVDSETFKKLYFVHSVFMRSPHRYTDLSRTVHEALLNSWDSEPNPELIRERWGWTPEVLWVVVHTADAMQHVLMDYSSVFKVYFFIARRRWFVERISRKVRSGAKRFVVWLEKRNPSIVELLRAQAAIYRLVNNPPPISV